MMANVACLYLSRQYDAIVTLAMFSVIAKH
jgi:hypothetical protein